MKYFLENEQIIYAASRVKYGSLGAKQKAKVQFPDHIKNDTALIKLDAPIGAFDPRTSEGYPDIWSEFAFADFSKGERIERFFEDYGPPEGDYPADGPHYYPVQKFLNERFYFHVLVQLYINRERPARLVELINIAAPGMYPDITHDNAVERLSGRGGILDIMLNPHLREFTRHTYYDHNTGRFEEWTGIKSLLHSIYVRFNQLMLDNAELIQCKNFSSCHFYYLPTSGKQVYHSVQCRQSYYDHPERRRLKKVIAGFDKGSPEYKKALAEYKAFDEKQREGRI